MIGASISGWTMSCFWVVLLALLRAELPMIAGFGFPSQPTNRTGERLQAVIAVVIAVKRKGSEFGAANPGDLAKYEPAIYLYENMPIDLYGPRSAASRE